MSLSDNPISSLGNNFTRLCINGGVFPLLFFTHNALQIFSKYRCPKNKLWVYRPSLKQRLHGYLIFFRSIQPMGNMLFFGHHAMQK